MHLGAALGISYIEVELLIGCGGFTAYQFLTNSECYIMFTSSGYLVAHDDCNHSPVSSV